MLDNATAPSSDLDVRHLAQWLAARQASVCTHDHPGTRAAVLVPLVERPQGITIMLTQRTDHLDHHPGQISFPGGRLEPDDNFDPITCALRETMEEIGLATAHVQVLGTLDERTTGTGFRVIPVVGVVTPPFQLTLDDFEVAEVFEIPLAFFRDPANRRRIKKVVDGKEWQWWSFHWNDKHIWGLTALILVTMNDDLAAAGFF